MQIPLKLTASTCNIHSRTSLICSPLLCFPVSCTLKHQFCLASIRSCALASCYISLPGWCVQKIQQHNIDVWLFVSSVNANCPISSLKTVSSQTCYAVQNNRHRWIQIVDGHWCHHCSWSWKPKRGGRKHEELPSMQVWEPCAISF